MVGLNVCLYLRVDITRCIVYIFFFKQKTAYEMRISDWSSDVCSSDLMDVARPWIEKLIGGRYDAPLRPLAEKAGVTIGMAMTEKQGGSDVRANATCAEPIGGGRAFRLTGHKWFCSAPMSDAFLTLAYTKKGLSHTEKRRGGKES